MAKYHPNVHHFTCKKLAFAMLTIGLCLVEAIGSVLGDGEHLHRVTTHSH